MADSGVLSRGTDPEPLTEIREHFKGYIGGTGLAVLKLCDAYEALGGRVEQLEGALRRMRDAMTNTSNRPGAEVEALIALETDRLLVSPVEPPTPKPHSYFDLPWGVDHGPLCRQCTGNYDTPGPVDIPGPVEPPTP